MTGEQVEQLSAEVKRLYLEATAEDNERHPRRTVPDFRDHDGVLLQTFGRIYTARQLEGREIDDIAKEFVQRVVDFEHGLLTGAGKDLHVARCFLTGYETPGVFLKHPHEQDQDYLDEEDRGAVKLRHVFAVLVDAG